MFRARNQATVRLRRGGLSEAGWEAIPIRLRATHRPGGSGERHGRKTCACPRAARWCAWRVGHRASSEPAVSFARTTRRDLRAAWAALRCARSATEDAILGFLLRPEANRYKECWPPPAGLHWRTDAGGESKAPA